jgi:hypothetical protein
MPQKTRHGWGTQLGAEAIAISNSRSFDSLRFAPVAQDDKFSGKLRVTARDGSLNYFLKIRK